MHSSITLALTTLLTLTTAAPTILTPRSSGWTVQALTRTCATDSSSCLYNFSIDLNDGTTPTACSITNAVADAPDASWYAIPCSTAAPDFKVSWGYSGDAAPPFAVMTVVDDTTNTEAFFGYANVNTVTAFGDNGPQPTQAV